MLGALSDVRILFFLSQQVIFYNYLYVNMIWISTKPYETHMKVKAKVKVILRPTVNQSVCLGVKPNLGLLTRFFFLKLRSCLCGAPSLTRGRVSHLSFFKDRLILFL
jgi:hypothetical protein